jgi:hypothetical protein
LCTGRWCLYAQIGVQGVCAYATDRRTGRDSAPFLEGGSSEPGLAQLGIILGDLHAC